MKKSAFISDLVFAFSLTFIATLCILRFHRVHFFLALFFAAFIGGGVTLAVYGYLSDKRKKFFLKKSDEAEKEKLLLHLSLLPSRKQKEFFSSRLGGKIVNGSIELENEILLVDFRFEPLPPDRLGAFIRKKSEKTKKLLCNDLTEESKRLCERFGVQTLVATEVYTLLKEQGVLPKKYFGEESFSEKKKRQFSFWFSKANSKRFLLAGSLVLLTSLVTPFPYYYVVFGSILLTVAALTRIFGKTL